jgi:hypothetical protein
MECARATYPLTSDLSFVKLFQQAFPTEDTKHQAFNVGEENM